VVYVAGLDLKGLDWESDIVARTGCTPVEDILASDCSPRPQQGDIWSNLKSSIVSGSLYKRDQFYISLLKVVESQDEYIGVLRDTIVAMGGKVPVQGLVVVKEHGWKEEASKPDPQKFHQVHTVQEGGGIMIDGVGIE
jgi:hypothetical protein